MLFGKLLGAAFALSLCMAQQAYNFTICQWTKTTEVVVA
jgi:hypothetical protein